MNISYQLSRWELFFAILFMQLHQFFGIVVYALTALIFSYVSISVASSLEDTNFIVKLLVFIVFESFPVILMLLLVLLSTLISVFSRKNKSFLENRNMTFNEDFFVGITENSRSEIKWQALQRVVITGNFLFLYLSQSGAIIIPKRVFASALEWKDFIELCRSKLKKEINDKSKT